MRPLLPIVFLALTACAALEEYATQPKAPPRPDAPPPVGPPAQLVFIRQPISGIATEALSPAPTISVLDANGQVVSTATNVITLKVFAGKYAAYTYERGGITMPAQSGIAVFPDVRIPATGDGFSLAAESPGLTGVTSMTFPLRAGPAATIRIFLTVGSAQAGVPFDVRVLIQDRNGYAASWDAPISLVLENARGATITGPTSTFTSGIGSATFSRLTIDQPGTGYALRVSSTGLPDYVLSLTVR
jgi:hypothetical protein